MNYDIRQLQQHLLSQLLEVHTSFQAAGLNYYLVSGTMLGAVRHHGFIPWDDDIDIAMPRPDYERLIHDSATVLPPHLQFVAAENDPRYPLPYGKIQDTRTTVIEKSYRNYTGGTFIDIFPLDGVPATPLRRWWHFTRYLFWYKMLYYSWRDPYKHGRGPRSWFPLLVQHTIPLTTIQRHMRHILLEKPYDTSPHLSEHYNRQRRYLPRNVFGTPTPLPFEGTMLPGVEKPHPYLQLHYNDYMQLPPEDKRQQHHFFYLDLNHPYSDLKEKEE